MTVGNAAFPRTANGYSPESVDAFIGALAERARAQIVGLEQRISELEMTRTAPVTDAIGERLEKLERLVADREAQLAEERTRVLLLRQQLAESGGDDVSARIDVDANPEHVEVTIAAEPQDWAASVIGRASYNEWSDEQRERAALSLRRKRMSACTPVE